MAMILLGLLCIVIYLQPKSPLAALKKEYISKASILRYSNLIEQIDITSEKSLLFYYNGNGNVNCAVAEKIFYGYKIVNISAELPVHKDEWKVGLFGSTYEKGTQWVYFGIIYDDSVEKIFWNDVEAIRFSALNLEMFYAFGNGEFKGAEYHLYDSNGNELLD